MKITLRLYEEDMLGMERIFNTAFAHPTMMWVRCFERQLRNTTEHGKVRIDIECVFGNTHWELTYSDKWYLSYTEDEWFCDEALEFDTRNELFDFMHDILKNLEQTDKAEREWV